MEKFSTKKIILFSLLFAIVSIFFQGYSFGSEDHYEHFPSLNYYYNNSLYSNDIIFGEGSFDPLTHRLLSYIILNKFSNFSGITLDVLFFLSHLITRFFFFFLIGKISHYITKDNKSAIIAMFISIFFYAMPTLGSFKPIGHYFTPNLMVVPIFLLSLYLFLKNKYIIASVILGVCSYFHLTTSLLFFSLVAGALFFLFVRKKINVRQFVFPILIFFLISSYMFYLTFSYMGDSIVSDAGFIYEESVLRLAHHALPSYFSVIHYIIFAAYTGVSLFFSFSLRKKYPEFEFLFYFLITLVLLLVASYVLIEVFTVSTVIKLLPFRATLFSNLLFPIIASISGLLLFKNYRKNKLLSIALFGFLVLCTGYIFYRGGFSLKDVNIFNPIDSTYEELSVYMKDNTHVDSLFITPPLLNGFRHLSERAEVFNFKITGYWSPDAVAVEWVNRLHAFCNVTDDFVGFIGAWNHCDEKYDNFSTQEFLELAEEYGVDYIVVKSSNPLNLSLFYENSDFIVYSI